MKTEPSLALLWATLAVTDAGAHAWGARPRPVSAIHKPRHGAPRSAPFTRDTTAVTARPAFRTRWPNKAAVTGPNASPASGNQPDGAACVPPRFVPRPTDGDHDRPLAPNRLAPAPVARGPKQIRVSDPTGVATQAGWRHVAVILDLGSRRGAGGSTGPSGQSCRVIAALQLALQHRQPPKGRRHHRDRGVPYASAAMESFMAADKRECVGWSGGYVTRAQATDNFFACVETHCHRQRSHSALNYQTPVDFENQLN